MWLDAISSIEAPERVREMFAAPLTVDVVVAPTSTS